MFIRKLIITNFGKLSNMNITPSLGLNIVYGPNESGKSTLLSFIKYIFYGYKHKKVYKDITFKERYTSWESMSMSGSCDISTESDNYTIKRTDNGNISALSVINTDTGDVVKSISDPGKSFFGISSKVFCDINFIQDLSFVNDSSDKGEIISFLSDSSYEKSTYSSIKNTLEEKILNILSPKRKSSVTSVINDKISKNTDKLHRLKSECINIENKLKEIKQLENCINEIEKKNENMKNIIDYLAMKSLNDELNDLTSEKNTIENELLNSHNISGLSDEQKKLLVEDFFNLTNEVQLKKSKYVKSFALCVLQWGITLFTGLIELLTGNNYLFLFLCFLICSSIGLTIKTISERRLFKNQNNVLVSNIIKQNELRNSLGLTSLSECILYLSANNENSSVRNNDYLKKRLISIDNEIKIIKNKLLNFCDFKEQFEEIDINFFTNKDVNDIIEKNNELLLSYNEQLNKIRHYKNEYNVLCNEINNIENELEVLYEQKANAEHEASVYKCSLDILETALSNTKDDFIPELLKRTKDVFNRICSTEYELINITNELELTIKKDEFYKSSRYLSSGASDALYFALRIAIIDTISKTKSDIPIFIDDIFANMDDERAEKAMEFICKLSEKYQMFVCTCRKRELEFISNKKDVNVISL